jgi:hypothetical protein
MKFVLAAVVGLISLATVDASHADPSSGICDLEASWFDVDGNCVYSATEISHVITDPGPVFNYAVEPVCEAMDPGQSVCVRPVKCIEPEGTYRFVVLRWTDGSPPQQIGTVCFDDDESEDLGVITEHAIIRRIKALDWPSAELVVQPPNGKTLVNLRTNFYTELVDPVVIPVRMLGYRVEVRATPTSYTWHFGDGSPPVTGNDPGAPYAEDDSLRVSHIYTKAKVTVHPSVDVTYSGDYRVDGGPWKTLPTTLTKTGTTVDLLVLTATPHLVG